MQKTFVYWFHHLYEDGVVPPLSSWSPHGPTYCFNDDIEWCSDHSTSLLYGFPHSWLIIYLTYKVNLWEKVHMWCIQWDLIISSLMVPSFNPRNLIIILYNRTDYYCPHSIPEFLYMQFNNYALYLISCNDGLFIMHLNNGLAASIQLPR